MTTANIAKALEILKPLLEAIPHLQQGHFPPACPRCELFAAIKILESPESNEK